jgi:TetR/AcrR family tetracycline transcriptional repressor
LDRDELVRSAAVLLQREGYEALTIRKLAAELGVKSASLYWHIATKEELEDLLADALLADAPAPPRTEDWRADLRSGTLAMFRHLAPKRDAGRLLIGRFLAGPNALRWMEQGLGPFLRAGLSPRAAAFASHAVHVYTVGFIAFQGSPLSAEETAPGSRADVLAGRRRLFASLPAETYPNLRGLAEALTIPEPEERFLFGLDALIGGFAGAQ